jgi:nicotinate-nucleotide adenylyltransferase
MIRAVLGGTFDPVHRGHVAMARHLVEQRLAARVIVVPAWLSPHKEANTAPAADRLAMVELAFAGTAAVDIDRREIDRGRVCYTIDTLRELRDEYPGDLLRLVIGADNLAAFSAWKHPKRIQQIAEIVIYPRDGLTPSASAIADSALDPARVIAVTDFDHPVSSTALRAMLREGQVPHRLLPGGVADYITSRRLYAD